MPSFENKKVYVDDSFADIIPWFLDNRKEDLRKVREYTLNSDFEQISRMGHRWKGTCSSYGFDLLSEVGRLWEVLAASQKQQEILIMLEHTNDYINHVEVIYVASQEEGVTKEASF